MINNRFEELLAGPMEQVVRDSNKMGAYYALGSAGRMLYSSILFIIAIELLII